MSYYQYTGPDSVPSTSLTAGTIDRARVQTGPPLLQGFSQVEQLERQSCDPGPADLGCGSLALC